MNGIPSPCPCCGAYSLAPDTQTTILVAVCDVLVVKALERVGSFILRGPDRKRYQEAGALPRHAIHTVWRAPDELTARALQGAWDVVPALLDSHGCCDVASDDVIRVLDSYVHDLVITGTEHHVIGDDGLEHRFVCHLGLSLPRYERATA